jgi:hypothetical protein
MSHGNNHDTTFNSAVGLPSFFAVYDLVEKCENVWVIKDEFGGLEADAMFLDVDPIFIGVPLVSYRHRIHIVAQTGFR